MNPFLESTLKELEQWKEQNEILRERKARDQEKRELEKKRKELQDLFKPVSPFPEKEMTDAAKKSRIVRCRKDFWSFDKIYFPPDMYSDYSKPCGYHRKLISLTDLHDRTAHVIHGARGSGKTITFKKKLIYDALTGKRKMIGIASEILTRANKFLSDLMFLIATNQRIQNDFHVEFLEGSSESIYVRTDQNPKGTFIEPFSADRSARAAQRLFNRLDLMFVTDFENLTSSLTTDSIEWRIEIINEMRTSLSDNGTLIWEGNNFDEHCAMNRLMKDEETGILPDNFELHVFPAWTDLEGSIWPEKWPARSEEEMKKFCHPKDEHDWLGNFQGRPRTKSGDIFPDTHYHEWDALPDNLRAIIYVDPNLSLKSRGDTTAMPCNGFSVKTQKFYITSARCKSYSDSDTLLTDLLTMRKEEMARGVSVRCIFFDGNVSQESSWTNNIINFSRLHNFPYPPIDFRKYRVDDLTKNAQLLWNADKIYFPPGFRKTEEGKRFTDQLFSFRGKKAGRKDDAPDSFISAVEALSEMGIISTSGSGPEYYSGQKRNYSRRW